MSLKNENVYIYIKSYLYFFCSHLTRTKEKSERKMHDDDDTDRYGL